MPIVLPMSTLVVDRIILTAMTARNFTPIPPPAYARISLNGIYRPSAGSFQWSLTLLTSPFAFAVIVESEPFTMGTPFLFLLRLSYCCNRIIFLPAKTGYIVFFSSLPPAVLVVLYVFKKCRTVYICVHFNMGFWQNQRKSKVFTSFLKMLLTFIRGRLDVKP